MKVCKKPVLVEAWRWTFAPGGEDPPSWITDALGIQYAQPGNIAFWPDGNRRDDAPPEWRERPHIAVFTLEGEMRATPGDWLIRGVKGEIYPCKPDVFEATYEEVAALEVAP